MLGKREGRRLVFEEKEFREHLDQKLHSVAELITNLSMSLVVVSFALLCLYFRVPTYVYLLAFLIPFLLRNLVAQWVRGWLHREFDSFGDPGA
ncbi:hypothetical protein SAMN02746041_00103 [Desulfacinum hydrothermale DSM 13146]|uniref:Uncharacterized protein n=1 Tax=Desulfacinum hydrothermale DSM 13146 TaxID=1121390 RepID=A0A1W1WY50_9BACT|nr:hypothetical protein [Desulfacinum hydrothermale]SMC16537.1 hypothetical protein SAMN02746041_00103 [Desulfacinum hydrothermale DSM 13146]